jgi:hypothetical protein
MKKGENIVSQDDLNLKPVPKKKGRKPKSDTVQPTENTIVEPKIPKKRGRKPKGGKIIINSSENNQVNIPEQNIILHLKCRLSNLKTDKFSICNTSPNVLENCKNIEPFQFENKQDSINYKIINNTSINNNCNNEIKSDNNDSDTEYDKNSDICKKIKTLTVNLHTNNISEKKSACFWCTCDFDNPPIYIPKHELNNTYHCYGCFCSPECATAYLFKEPIDGSVRFERYHLINHLYCKIYNYEKNVKPAPNPFYTLDKYYGNLSIQEYRKLLKNERLLLVVDKPLTRILPELHEDNDDFILNNKSIPSGSRYQLRRSRQKQSKTDLLNQAFNLK